MSTALAWTLATDINCLRTQMLNISRLLKTSLFIIGIAFILQLARMYHSGQSPQRFSHISIRSDKDIIKAAAALPSLVNDATGMSTLSSFTFERILHRRRQPDTPLKLDEKIARTQDILAKYVDTLDLPTERYEELIDALAVSQQGDATIQADAYAHAAGTIILSLAHNLDALRLEQPQVSSPIYSFLKLNNHSGLSKTYLENLRHIYIAPTSGSIRTTDTRFYRELDIFGMLNLFHRLPNIESFTADSVTDGSEYNVVLPAHLSNLKKISITHSCLKSLTLAAMIRLPKQNYLEELHFTFGGRSASLNGSPAMQLKTIGKALDGQKLSLRILDLDIDDNVYFLRPEHFDDTDAAKGDGLWEEILEVLREDLDFVKDEIESGHPLWPWDVPETKTYGQTIGSLAEFTRLEVLRMGVKTLLGPPEAGPPPFRLVNALPVGLRELTLLGYRRGENEGYDGIVDEFLKLKGERFPSLTKIEGVHTTIEGGHSNYDLDRDENIMWQNEKWDDKWEVV